MRDTNKAPDHGVPLPDPALRRLDRLVGTWKLKGRPLSEAKDTIFGTTTFAWIHGDEKGSFFMQQDMEMDYAGMLIKSREIIGYDPQKDVFPSYVFSNMSPEALPYEWNVEGDTLMIAVRYGPLDARFTGTFARDGSSFSGGWRPSPGADEVVNAPYDVTATRVIG